ncbi:MAG: class I SAM-dependent methyltransferase, partial [Desulfobacteraceae bacterium]
YRSPERAAAYKQFHTSDHSWGRLVTYFEQRAIARELSRYNWSPSDRLLDIPCGTGILGGILHRFPLKVLASDISLQMMALCRGDYPADRFDGCVQADITSTPFPQESFSCVITLGFFHRVPSEIRRKALREIAALSTRVVILTCSVDTAVQRIKQAILTRIKPNHAPAPCPVPLREMIADCRSLGLRLARSYMVVPVLSAHAILVLEKQ